MFAMYEEKNGQGVRSLLYRRQNSEVMVTCHTFFYMRKYAIIEFNKCQILSRKSVTKCAEESQRF